MIPHTPQEISDYKRGWMSNIPYSLSVHTDLRSRAIEWCKAQLMKHEWHHVKHTEVYHDTFYFQSNKAANAFAYNFKL